jgi:hypothetical protein
MLHHRLSVIALLLLGCRSDSILGVRLAPQSALPSGLPALTNAEPCKVPSPRIVSAWPISPLDDLPFEMPVRPQLQAHRHDEDWLKFRAFYNRDTTFGIAILKRPAEREEFVGVVQVSLEGQVAYGDEGSCTLPLSADSALVYLSWHERARSRRDTLWAAKILLPSRTASLMVLALSPTPAGRDSLIAAVRLLRPRR